MPADSPGSSVRSLQAQRAAASRWDLPNETEIARDYAAAKLEEHIKRAIAAAPPLTASQRARLRDILAPSIGGGDHAPAA